MHHRVQKRHLSLSRRAAARVGIKIRPIVLETKYPLNTKYLFRFPWFRREDDKAIRFAESILYTFSVIAYPIIDKSEEAVIFRIPKELVQGHSSVKLDHLVQLEESRDWEERITNNPHELIGSGGGASDHLYQLIWEYVPFVYEDPKFYEAVRFLSDSQDNFMVWPGQIRDVLSKPEEAARTGFEQSLLETALHSAFKAIEAVIGDPPKDDRKLAQRLHTYDLDFDEEVGYEKALKPLGQVIREMNIQRDKKTAHGSTTPRTIKIHEMMEYQACARYIVLAALAQAANQ